jgi:hypothetical protein
MQEEHALLSDEFDSFGDDDAGFGDDDEVPEEGDTEADALVDARLIEMREALDALRDCEVSDALRRLRQLFPHIPFPFRVHALMAARHQVVVG